MRELAILLLDDDYGINWGAWQMLSSVLDEENCDDIVVAVGESDGRFYLPENFCSN